jgi:hypothetical protein
MRISTAMALAAAALLGSGAQAQDAAPAAEGSERINQLIVYGDDPCPASTSEEITVCARKPEAERYRIPENLRDDPLDRRNETWTARATELQYVGRSGIGSCSPTGPGGMIGCYDQLVREARAERAQRDSVNWNRLIEEARQERLSRIDAEAEAAEREANDPN